MPRPRPGILIGKRGAGVEQLRTDLQKLTANELFVDIQEVRKAETNAQLVAENIATQLERRVAFRRAMKKAVSTAMKFGVKGIRVRREDGLVARRSPEASNTVKVVFRCTRCGRTSSLAKPLRKPPMARSALSAGSSKARCCLNVDAACRLASA